MNPTRKSHSILKWLSPFIPAVYRRNPYLHGKIQAYIISLMGISIFGALFAILSKFHLQTTEYATLDIIVACACVFVNIIAILVLRLTKRLGISYAIASINGLIVLDIITFDSGGLYSTTLLWTIFIPIGASSLLNIRSGIIWSFIIILNAFFFYILENFFFPEIIQTVEPPLVRVIDFAF